LEYLTLYLLCRATNDKEVWARAAAEVDPETVERLGRVAPQVLVHPLYKETKEEDLIRGRMLLIEINQELRLDKKMTDNTGKLPEEIEEE